MKLSSILRIKQLESDIPHYAQMYYQDGSSPLSDAEFDALVNELRTLKPTSSILKDVGWGYNVQDDNTPGQKCKHRYGIISGLDKCHNIDELGLIYCNHPIYASLKLDGISVVLYYKDNVVVQALTRGDGTYGIDITDKVKLIDSSLCSLENRYPFSGAVRGEILMTFDNFEKFKASNPDAKNPRNSTAGIINAKEVDLEDLKLINIVVYTVVGLDGRPCYSISGMDDVIDWLNTNFSYVAPYAQIAMNKDEFISNMESLKSKWYNNYPADGIVLTNTVHSSYDSDKHQTELTYEAKAFKFPSEVKNTEVVGIEWNLSKSRYLVPKVKLTPIELARTTVSYCTGYNAKYISDNNIGLGAIVEVEKRGEIIPNINKVIVSSKCELPSICPDCSHDLVWEGVHLKCTNPNCGNASRQDLIVWLDNISPVDGLGDSIRIKFLETLIDDSELLSIESVMNISSDKRKAFCLTAPGGHKQLISKMLDKLLNPEIKIPSYKAIQALNVPRFGELTAKKFANRKDVFTVIMRCACEGYELPDYSSILGKANMQSVRDNLQKFKRLKCIWDRIEFDCEKSETPENKGKVAITGKLSVRRSEFENELRSLGYQPSEISKDTKFLITDSPDWSSSKNKKLMLGEFRKSQKLNLDANICKK